MPRAAAATTASAAATFHSTYVDARPSSPTTTAISLVSHTPSPSPAALRTSGPLPRSTPPPPTMAFVATPTLPRMAADGPSATAPPPSEEEVESLGDAAVAAFERGVAGAVSARRHADPKVAVRTMLTRLLDASPTPINLTALGIIRLNVSEQDFLKLTDVSPRLLWVDSYRREVHVSEEGYIAAIKRWLKANPQ